MTREDMTATEFQMDGEPGSGAGAPHAHGLGQRLPFKAPQLGKGNLVLTVMFVAGIAGVFLLGARSGPLPALAQQSQAQVQVESALSRFTASPGDKDLLGNNDEAMINTFYYEARHRHIPLSNLKSNPFVFTPGSTADVRGRFVDGTWTTAPMEDGRALEYGQALLEARKLTLQTILKGSRRSTAMISGSLLAEGQRIRGWTVSKIRPKEVVLTWKDKTYVLKLPSQN